MGITVKKNPKAVKAVQGQATISVEHKSGAETTTTETPFPAVLVEGGTPAMVEVSIGLTRNLGNFESVRLYVGLTLPCAATPEEIDNTYSEAKGWVDCRIESLSSDIDKELGK